MSGCASVHDYVALMVKGFSCMDSYFFVFSKTNENYKEDAKSD